MIRRVSSFVALIAAMSTSVASRAHAQEQAADTPSASAEGEASEENAFTSAAFAITDADVRIDLSATRVTGASRVRTEPGFVRVWFDDMTGWTALDLDGDGGAIRFVRARQGAGDSNVVIVRVGDGRRVPEAAVRVTQDGAHASISIARDALPAARGMSAPSVAVEAVAERAVAVDAVAVDAVAAAHEPEVESALADELDAATETAAPAAHAVLRDRDGSTDGGTLALDDGERGPHVWSLLGITALLLLALGAVRLYQSRRATKGLEPSIRIVAATRLSPKQQLVVVRALGQDHLLAVEPGRTERLFSITTPTETAALEEPLLELRLSREPGPPSGASQGLAALPLSQAAHAASLDLEALSSRSPAHAPTLLGRTLAAIGLGARPSAPAPSPLAAAIAPSAAASPASFAATPFGRELARLVDARAETPLPSSSASITPGAGSAVAGLVRLRAQAQAGRA